MKIIRGLVIFSFFGIFCFSCFSPPEFATTPSIEFESVEYVQTSDGFDSLIVYITFKDGDGDLGLDPTETAPPYHEKFYFLEKGDGTLEKINTYGVPFLVDPADGQIGKLVTDRTRNKPGYEYLPTDNCVNYNTDVVYIREEHKWIFDDSYHIEDTLATQIGTVYVLQDNFYYELNPDNKNIEVDFLIKNSPDQEFQEFDWMATYCHPIDGRFPRLADKPRPLEGSLRYGMVSFAFGSFYNSQTLLKLRIKIKDRALNTSNVIESRAFTLAEIRR